MFESVTADPGADGLRRAARIFFVVAILSAIGGALLAILALSSGVFPLGVIVRIVMNLAFAALAWFTGRGIEDQKNWAKWLGLALGVLELFNFPVGTVIGIAILVYLQRAIKAGLFARPQSTAAYSG